MKKIMFLFEMMFFFAAGSAAQIQGDVVDSTDKGVANAMVIATGSVNKSSDTIMTDDRGFYAFKNLKPGKYKIEVKANGFYSAIFENIMANARLHERPGRDDVTNATRLDITLKPDKFSK